MDVLKTYVADEKFYEIDKSTLITLYPPDGYYGEFSDFEDNTINYMNINGTNVVAINDDDVYYIVLTETRDDQDHTIEIKYSTEYFLNGNKREFITKVNRYVQTIQDDYYDLITDLVEDMVEGSNNKTIQDITLQGLISHFKNMLEPNTNFRVDLSMFSEVLNNIKEVNKEK